MKKHQSGFILLMTILMISALTLFVLSVTHRMFLYLKMQNQLYLSHQNFYELEEKAKQLLANHAGADLGIFPCLEIKLNEVRYSSHHWLVTVKHKNQQLQLRIATLDESGQCELPISHVINPGVLSWHYTRF